MNRLELILCYPLLPLFAGYSAYCEALPYSAELRRMHCNWAAYWETM